MPPEWHLYGFANSDKVVSGWHIPYTPLPDCVPPLNAICKIKADIEHFSQIQAALECKPPTSVTNLW